MSAFSGTSRTCRGYFATAAVGAETDMDRVRSYFAKVPEGDSDSSAIEKNKCLERRAHRRFDR